MQAKETTQSTPDRTPYRTPKLQRFGQLASLTAGGSSPFIVEDSTIVFSGLG